jgi:hypothetical protein
MSIDAPDQNLEREAVPEKTANQQLRDACQTAHRMFSELAQEIPQEIGSTRSLEVVDADGGVVIDRQDGSGGYSVRFRDREDRVLPGAVEVSASGTTATVSKRKFYQAASKQIELPEEQALGLVERIRLADPHVPGGTEIEKARKALVDSFDSIIEGEDGRDDVKTPYGTEIDFGYSQGPPRQREIREYEQGDIALEPRVYRIDEEGKLLDPKTGEENAGKAFKFAKVLRSRREELGSAQVF